MCCAACVAACAASTFSRRTPRSTASSGTRASRMTTSNSQRSRTLCEPSSSAAANAVDSDTVLARSLRSRPPTQGRPLADSVSSRLSTVFRRTASKPVTPTPPSSRRRRHCRWRLAVCSASRRPSSTTSRASAAAVSLQCPCVRSSTSPSSPLSASRPTSRPSGCGSRRSQPRAMSNWRARRRRRRHRRHSTQALSSEQLNLSALRLVGTQEIWSCRSFEV
jgi:hypothetical protein